MKIFEIVFISIISLAAFWIIVRNVKKAYNGEGCSSCSANCKYRDRCKI